MAIIEREAALVTKVGSDQVLLLPYTNIANVEGGVASVNGITPDTSGAVTMPVATATLASTVRLYSTTGTATDGALTQAAITTALGNKLDANGTAAMATADDSGNVITSTYATKTELNNTGEAAVEVAQEYTDGQIAANKYVLPAATSSILGGVLVGSNISVANGVISVADGTTSAKGVVQLSSATNSTSTTLAATASAVKAAYDLAANKQDPATTLAGYGITNAYTKSEVDTKVAGLVDSAPEALNTLNELAAALGNDSNFATTVSTEIGKKANTSDLAQVALSGDYGDLINAPTSLPANGGNADTVNGLTVLTAVPANAKFTYTTYTLSSFGISATAAELNVLDGITATVTELNYVDGVTSNIQTQLNNKLSTTGKAASATVADSANAVAWANVTGKPSIPAVTKATFTATDSRWGSVSDGKYPLTIAANGGEFLNCYRTNGSVYDKVDVSVTVSGNNIIIYSLDKFAGYMTYISL